MKILLTNDDGFGAEGLDALITVLSKEHEVWVVAPNKNRSAVSHGITITEPLCIRKVSNQQYTCSGVPADCADVGLKIITNGKPDVIVSGINRGANIGTDILYSGTAAAARQASMHGIPGIAVSLESVNQTWNYTPIANFVEKNLDNLIKLCEKDVFVNINAADTTEIKGWRFTRPSRRIYNDFPVSFNAPDGCLYTFFKGGDTSADNFADADYTCVEEGFVSISRILAQPCSAGVNDCLQKLDFMI